MRLTCPLHGVTLRLRHPSTTPAEMSDRMGLQPDVAWRAGEPRKTPRGTMLDGCREENYWSHSTSGHEHIVSAIESVAERLDATGGWAKEFVATGGEVEIYVSLVGIENGGETLSPQLLGRLAGLGVCLSLEIFPTAQRR